MNERAKRPRLDTSKLGAKLGVGEEIRQANLRETYLGS